MELQSNIVLWLPHPPSVPSIRTAVMVVTGGWLYDHLLGPGIGNILTDTLTLLPVSRGGWWWNRMDNWLTGPKGDGRRCLSEYDIRRFQCRIDNVGGYNSCYYTYFTILKKDLIMSWSNFNELGFYEVFMKLSMSNSFKNEYWILNVTAEWLTGIFLFSAYV